MRKILGLLLVAALALAGCARQSAESINRLALPVPMEIAHFELTDQHGQHFDSEVLVGKPTLYTFSFTACSDTCTYQAVKVRQLIEVLGEDASKFNFVAITIDPARDTPEVLQAYSEAMGLDDKWHFLTGSEEELKPIWADFNVAVAKQSLAQALASQAASAELGLDHHAVPDEMKELLPTNGLSAEQLAFASEIIERFAGGYEVAHSAPFWIGTAENMRQVAFSPGALVGELKDELLAQL